MVVISFFWACSALVQACLVLMVAGIRFPSHSGWLPIIWRVSCVAVEHIAVWLVSSEAKVVHAVEISVSNTQQHLLIYSSPI